MTSSQAIDIGFDIDYLLISFKLSGHPNQFEAGRWELVGSYFLGVAIFHLVPNRCSSDPVVANPKGKLALGCNARFDVMPPQTCGFAGKLQNLCWPMAFAYTMQAIKI